MSSPWLSLNNSDVLSDQAKPEIEPSSLSDLPQLAFDVDTSCPPTLVHLTQKEDPARWSPLKKWLVTASLAIQTCVSCPRNASVLRTSLRSRSSRVLAALPHSFVVSFCSAAYSGALGPLLLKFRVTHEIVALVSFPSPFELSAFALLMALDVFLRASLFSFSGSPWVLSSSASSSFPLSFAT